MQVRKEEIRNRILNAALETFAAKGLPNTTMADIAMAAGLSVGNLYLYYHNKADLINSSITKEFIAELKLHLFQKLNLANGASLKNIKERPDYSLAGAKLIAFLAENRLKIIIILDNANQALFPGVKEEIIGYLNDLFGQYQNSIKDGSLPAENNDIQPLIRTVYSSLINSIVELLKLYPEKNALQLQLKKLLDYHLFGLSGLLV
jgi:AcrR family transcriptional regulator